MKKEYVSPSVDVVKILSKPYCNLTPSDMDLTREPDEEEAF